METNLDIQRVSAWKLTNMKQKKDWGGERRECKGRKEKGRGGEEMEVKGRGGKNPGDICLYAQ